MIKLPKLDDRTYADFAGDARTLIQSLVPAWTDHNPSDPGIALVELFSWLAEIVLYRIDRVPERSYQTFLALLRGPLPPNDPVLALPIEEAIRTTVAELRDRYRAITTDDFEYLALHRWPTVDGTAAMGAPGVVRRALCVAEHSPKTLASRWRTPSQIAEGHVTLIVVPESLAATRNDLPAFAPARRWALELDGKTTYVNCGADKTLSVLGALTLSAWIFPRTQHTRQGLVGKAAAGEYELLLEPNGALTFLQGNGGAGSSHVGAVPVGRWSHVAAVRAFSGDSVTLFVDAKPVGTVPLATAPTSTTNPVLIGRLSGGGGFFDGFVRDVAIWNVARTAVELGGDLRQAPLGVDQVPSIPPVPPLPVASWRFDTATTPVPDCETPAATPPALRHRDGVVTGGRFRDIVRPLDAGPALLDGLAALLDEWRLLTTHVDVVGYTPLRVTVAASLYLRADADLTAVPAAAAAALDRFLDPLTGWQGTGWPFGRAIYNFDVHGALDGVPGVDFVTDVQISLVDAAQIAAVAAHTRPPPPSQASTSIGVALQPEELPSFTGATFAMYQRVGTKWQKM